MGLTATRACTSPLETENQKQQENTSQLHGQKVSAHRKTYGQTTSDTNKRAGRKPAQLYYVVPTGSNVNVAPLKDSYLCQVSGKTPLIMAMLAFEA